MNFVVHGVHNYNLSFGDIFEFDPTKENKYDLVVSQPPFLIRNRLSLKSSEDIFPTTSTAESAIILHILKSLKNGGIAFVVTPSSFGSRPQDRRWRKLFIENSFLSAIISLPAKVLNNSYIKTDLLILQKKSKKNNYQVLLIDLKIEFIEQKFKNDLSEENIEKISKTYHEKITEKNFSKFVFRSKRRSFSFK